MNEFVIKEITSLKFCDGRGNPLIDSRDEEPVEGKFNELEESVAILKKTTVPFEYWNNKLFTRYGYGVNDIDDKWVWTAELSNAEEEHIWKMIALCEAYWRNKYEYWYRKEVKQFRDYKREKGDLPKDIGINIDLSDSISYT